MERKVHPICLVIIFKNLYYNLKNKENNKTRKTCLIFYYENKNIHL